jgi:hypothetical protein
MDSASWSLRRGLRSELKQQSFSKLPFKSTRPACTTFVVPRAFFPSACAAAPTHDPLRARCPCAGFEVEVGTCVGCPPVAGERHHTRAAGSYHWWMGDHYVTQGYLRAWEVERRLWVYDREQGRGFMSRAKSVANESGLYSPELEALLAEQYDDKAIVALRRFSEGTTLSEADRDIIARFLFVQWKRVPVGKRRIMERMPVREQETERELMGMIDAAVAIDPAFEADAEAARRNVRTVFEKWGRKDRVALWHRLVTETTGPGVHEAIKSMNWVLIRVPDDSLFTCDNPLYFDTSIGLGREQSELTFPLSPSTALWAMRRSITPAAVARQGAKLGRQINARTAHNSARWVFAQREQPWMEPFLKKRSRIETR